MRTNLHRSAAIVFFVAMAGRARGDLADGLVGYWPLAGDAVDASGNGHDGAMRGALAPVEDRFGNPDAALLFPGTSDAYIDLGDRPAFRIAGAMTLSAWVILDPNNGDRNGRIVAKSGGGGQRSFSLNIESAGMPATFQIAPNPNATISLNDTQPLPRGEWVHVAGVFRPGEMELYVDGELRARQDAGIPDAQFSENGLSVLIGGRHACGNCGWLGAIDEVAIWNRDLSEEEILEVMEREAIVELPELRVRIVESGGSTLVDEADPAAADSYAVVLTAAPASPVEVSLAFDAEEIEVSPSKLTFAAADFDVPRTVTVSAVDDGRPERASHTTKIVHTATGGGFQGEDVGEVAVTIIDRYVTADPLLEGLVGYWPLAGDAIDAAGRGLDGEIRGAVIPAEDRFGKEDAALRFPGSSEAYVDLGDDPAFRIAGAMTVSAWVLMEPAAGDRNPRIVAKQGGAGQRAWTLNAESAAGYPTFQIAGDPNAGISIADAEPLPAFEWIHLAGVFRPGEIELYVDGELRGRLDVGVPDAQFVDNGLSVLIGGRHACGNCAWLGAIDEVAIWRRDLTEDEILEVVERESLLEKGPKEIFLRGDTDGNGTYTIGDGIQILERLFTGRPAFASDCEDTADADDDGLLTIGDAIWIFNFLFASGPSPAPPHPTCGADPTPGDPFDCAGYPADRCP